MMDAPIHPNQETVSADREAEIRKIRKKISFLARNIAKWKYQLTYGESKIKKLNQDLSALKRPVMISDHAFVRFFQRVKKLKFEDIEHDILPPYVQEEMRYRDYADGVYFAETHAIKLKNGVIITIFPPVNNYRDGYLESFPKKDDGDDE